MNPEQDVLKALRALGECDRDRQASPDTEARLKLGFRRYQRVRSWRRISAWAIAAAVVVAIVAAYARGPRPGPVTNIPRNVAPAEPALAAPVARLKPDPVVVRQAPRVPARRAVEREIVTNFFPLMDVAPPIGRGALVRVNLPAEAMRTVGLPVREDRLAERVQADVLLSEDGLATAIRFVKVSQ